MIEGPTRPSLDELVALMAGRLMKSGGRRSEGFFLLIGFGRFSLKAKKGFGGCFFWKEEQGHVLGTMFPGHSEETPLCSLPRAFHA